jgi:uncharacterized protein YecT (DUF1311 family)
MSRLAILAVLCTLPLAGARAQMPAQGECSKTPTPGELSWCADPDLIEADRAFNKVYQEALAIIADSSDTALRKQDREEALKQSQSAWIAFREQDCKRLIPLEWDRGTGTGDAVRDCLVELTRARIKALSERYVRP